MRLPERRFAYRGKGNKSSREPKVTHCIISAFFVIFGRYCKTERFKQKRGIHGGFKRLAHHVRSRKKAPYKARGCDLT